MPRSASGRSLALPCGGRPGPESPPRPASPRRSPPLVGCQSDGRGIAVLVSVTRILLTPGPQVQVLVLVIWMCPREAVKGFL